MRNAFFRALKKLFVEDNNVYFITGDLGFKLYDELQAHDPDRVINAGIREAAIAGMSAGLASEGALPFIYSITPFITLRCLEQIKLDICYHNFKVAIIGVGGGLAYGENGPTHHGVEDLALMRLLPRMSVFCPAGPVEVEKCVAAVKGLDGPVYIRLGRNGEPELTAPGVEPDIFGPQIMVDGTDINIIATGPVAGAAMAAEAILTEEGISARVVKVTRLKPLDEAALLNALVPGRPVAAVEEHTGGAALALPVADALLRAGAAPRFAKICIPDEFPRKCGSHSALMSWAGLDAESIARVCGRLVRGS